MYKPRKFLQQCQELDYPYLSIIVLTHNAVEFSRKCIDSIQAHTVYPYELIIVDDASTDGTHQWLETIKNVKWIKNSERQGVAFGRNRGINFASTNQREYREPLNPHTDWSGLYVFLDNDTEVADGWDIEIIGAFKSGKVGVVGKQGDIVLDYDPLRFGGLDQSKMGGKYTEVDVVAGFCFAIRKEMVKVVGMFDESLGKFWHEDLEYCMRVEKAGWKILANNDIPIVHHGHRSIDGSEKTNDEVIKHYEGFYSIAKEVYKKHRESNLVKIYREADFNHYGSFSVIADHTTQIMRELGYIVLRMPHRETPEASFNLCKTFEIDYNRKKFVVIHSENDIPPKSWLEQLNQYDYVFAASKFVYQSLINLGFDREKLLNYSPDGVDHEVFNLNASPTFNFSDGLSKDRFTFLTVGASQPRKGTDVLIKAFVEEFTDKDNVQLIIKNYDYGQSDWVNQLINQYARPNSAPIKHYYGTWTPDLLAKLYATTARNGIYIQSHRAEGFGLTPLEAAFCGCRVIVTNFGGVTETLASSPDDFVQTIGYDLEPSKFHNHSREPFYTPLENPKWAEPKLDEVKYRMRLAYQSDFDYKEELDWIREWNSSLVSRYSFYVRARNFANMLQEYGCLTQ